MKAVVFNRKEYEVMGLFSKEQLDKAEKDLKSFIGCKYGIDCYLHKKFSTTTE